MITEADKLILYKIAQNLFDDNVGGALWCDDKRRVEYYEFGEYSIGNNETYEITSVEECDYVLEQLFDLCDMCHGCGWIWWIDHMGVYNGDLLCDQCAKEQGYMDEDE